MRKAEEEAWVFRIVDVLVKNHIAGRNVFGKNVVIQMADDICKRGKN